MTARPGPHNALSDIAGLQIGCAHDATVRSGVTLIVPDGRFVCGADVRGGGPGVREIEALNPEGVVDAVDAVVLAGGSVYGLAAADELAVLLGQRGRGFQLIDRPGVPPSPIIPAAILYDLANGGDKAWADAPPYRRLTREAFAALAPQTPQGKAGAGFGARAGAYEGGQGSASAVTHDGFTVAALACVNSFGSVMVPGAEAFWAAPFEIDGEFGGARAAPGFKLDPDDWGAAKANPGLRQNTTIAIVAVDAALDKGEARRLAQMASAGMARAIRPVFAPTDGDVIFALASGAKDLVGPRPLALARLGNLAADCLARAIARGVYLARD
jgi:L-aminopeptidase/D-esterase-like protein